MGVRVLGTELLPLLFMPLEAGLPVAYMQFVYIIRPTLQHARLRVLLLAIGTVFVACYIQSDAGRKGRVPHLK